MATSIKEFRVCQSECGAVDALARPIAAGPTTAHAILKRLVDQALHTPLDAQLDAERAGFIKAAGTQDFRQGVAAFLERRTPLFGGESGNFAA
jgi:2-(1,2-epoxy-1,2-dihydrophenyl)acetyl-CoA isomerase